MQKQKLNYSLIACKFEDCNAIGYNNDLIYKLPREITRFQAITIGDKYCKGSARNVVVMGYHTFKSLQFKPLKHRINVVLSRIHYDELLPFEQKHENVYLLRELKYLSTMLKHMKSPLLGEVFIIGGSQIYKSAIEENICSRMLLTDIKGKCPITSYSRFAMPLLNTWHLSHESAVHEERDVFCIPLNVRLDSVQYVFREYQRVSPRTNTEELAYLQLMKEAIGAAPRKTRNGVTRAVFGKSLSFDLAKGFPLLTTKRMPFKSKMIEKELLFFLSGETNNTILKKQGVSIWNANTTQEFLDMNGKNLKEDDMGPMYGHQFRHFGADYGGCTQDYGGKGIDQLQNLIKSIQRNPHSRRHVMTSLNMAQVEQGCLWPCHSLMLQCFVRGEYLDLLMYQRSADIFLGLPFNIASSALLLKLLAQQTSRTPGVLTITIGDAHIYEKHLEQAQQQVLRTPFAFPNYTITRRSCIDEYTLHDFKLNTESYTLHSSIKAEMVA